MRRATDTTTVLEGAFCARTGEYFLGENGSVRYLWCEATTMMLGYAEDCPRLREERNMSQGRRSLFGRTNHNASRRSRFVPPSAGSSDYYYRGPPVRTQILD